MLAYPTKLLLYSHQQRYGVHPRCSLADKGSKLSIHGVILFILKKNNESFRNFTCKQFSKVTDSEKSRSHAVCQTRTCSHECRWSENSYGLEEDQEMQTKNMLRNHEEGNK